VFNIRPDMEFVATFPCVLTTYDYKPAFHVHYGSKILSVTDGELLCYKLVDLVKALCAPNHAEVCLYFSIITVVSGC
jgi:hypothetical protein